MAEEDNNQKLPRLNGELSESERSEIESLLKNLNKLGKQQLARVDQIMKANEQLRQAQKEEEDLKRNFKKFAENIGKKDDSIIERLDGLLDTARASFTQQKKKDLADQRKTKKEEGKYKMEKIDFSVLPGADSSIVKMIVGLVKDVTKFFSNFLIPVLKNILTFVKLFGKPLLVVVGVSGRS